MAKIQRPHGTADGKLRVFIPDSSSTTGAGLTGLTSASSGLIIATIADNEATATAYTVTGSTIETITTIGTFAEPTATKCRFKEVDSTNLPGWYEIHLAVARFAVASATLLHVAVTGATNAAPVNVEIQLDLVDQVWDEAITTSVHNDAQSAGKYLRQIRNLSVLTEATVTDANITPTTTTFDLTVDASEADLSWSDRLLTFVSGDNATGDSGECAPIVTTTQIDATTIRVTFDEPFSNAPADGDEVLAGGHVHPITQIADKVLTRTAAEVEAGALGGSVDKSSLYGTIMRGVEFSISGSVLTVYKSDGATVLGTIDLTGTSGAAPITAGTSGS